MSRYATGVVVVTTCADGVDHAMTANSFTSVSLAPPLVLVCVDRDSRFDEAIASTNCWAVSILPEGAAEVARWFATRGRPLQNQFEGVPATRGHDGALLVDGALGHLECTTERLEPAGDHDILLGRVTHLHRPPPDSAKMGPLLYFDHEFRGLMGE